VVMALNGFDTEAVELEDFAFGAEPFNDGHFVLGDAARAAYPFHRDRIADDQRAGLRANRWRVAEMLAVRLAKQDGGDVLGQLVRSDGVRRTPAQLAKPRIQKDHVVAVRKLVVRDSKEPQDDDVGVLRKGPARRCRDQRLTRGLLVERRIAGLSERGS